MSGGWTRQDDWLGKKKLALSSGVFDSSIGSALEVCQSRDDRDDPIPLTLFHYEFGGELPGLGLFQWDALLIRGRKSDLKLHYTEALPKTGVEEKRRWCYNSPPLAY